MDYHDMLSQIGAIKDAATVQRVFGEPQVLGEKMVIPVAEVRTCLGLGYGGGESPGAQEAPLHGEGGGGGGGLLVRPAGVLEVTPEATTFIPVKPAIPPALYVLGGLALGLWWAGRRNRRRHDE